jgi:SAM-dependent methyltransferase
MNIDYKYPGEELALFEKAINWKKYFAHFIRPWLTGYVLETGAGTGGTTVLLNNNTTDHWLLSEPDKTMRDILQKKINTGLLPANCQIHSGTIDLLGQQQLFDCIIYIDVLEHIEDDAGEIRKAATHLKPGGRLIILSPAFNLLYSPFDKTIGHYRRYTKHSLSRLADKSLARERLFYLDTVGFFASLVNRLLLKQSYPTQRQISFWDKWMIPVSKITDRIFFYSFGKSILAVWKKQ